MLRDATYGVYLLTLTWMGRIVTPCWFLKAVNLACAALSNFLLDAFLPNLKSLTCPSFQILGKAQTGLFPNSDFW